MRNPLTHNEINLIIKLKQVPFGIDPGWSFLTSTELTQQEPTTETQNYNWKESTFKKQLWIIHWLKTPNDYIKVEIKWRFPYGWKKFLPSTYLKSETTETLRISLSTLTCLSLRHQSQKVTIRLKTGKLFTLSSNPMQIIGLEAQHEPPFQFYIYAFIIDFSLFNLLKLIFTC